jgi:hypothetical protein
MLAIRTCTREVLGRILGERTSARLILCYLASRGRQDGEPEIRTVKNEAVIARHA